MLTGLITIFVIMFTVMFAIKFFTIWIASLYPGFAWSGAELSLVTAGNVDNLDPDRARNRGMVTDDKEILNWVHNGVREAGKFPGEYSTRFLAGVVDGESSINLKNGEVFLADSKIPVSQIVEGDSIVLKIEDAVDPSYKLRCFSSRDKFNLYTIKNNKNGEPANSKHPIDLYVGKVISHTDEFIPANP